MPSKITDHADQAVSRLPYDLRKQPKLEAFVRALVGPIQTLEDALWQLLVERAVGTATGVTLEALGRLVGQPPTGLDTETYRRYIRARIRANKSCGTVEDFIKITRLILNDDDAQIIIERQGVAAAVERILGIVVDDDLANVLIGFLVDAASGEGRIILETLTDVEDETFTLAIATFLDGPLVGAETTIPVISTDGFPTSGSLDIDVGLADEETVTYTGITSTSFLGVSAVVNAHVTNSCIQLSGAPGKGLGDSTDANVGGKLMSARDQVT
jgi:hypothetical protein